MRCSDVTDRLENLSPLMYAEDWDNVGLLAGRGDKEIETVMIAVDATDEVVEQAVKQKVSMLLTHHPLLFSPLKKVSTEDFIGRRIFRLIGHDICYYAMHTNFDVMGMADASADEMKLKNREVLDITYEDEISKEGIGRIGKLPEIMTLQECAEYVSRVFQIEHVKVFGDKDTMLERAAVSPGSGKGMYKKAVQKGADVLITGDIDHHEGIDALAHGLCVIDAGHFGLEKIFVPYMTEYFKRELPELQIYQAEEQAPFWIL